MIIIVNFNSYQVTGSTNQLKGSSHTQIIIQNNYWITNERISNTAYEFYQVDNIRIIGNVFSNVSINIMDSTNVIIEDNIFSNSPDIVIIVWNTPIKIINNILEDIPETGIQIFETTGSLIRSNKIILNDYNPNQWAINQGVLIDRSPNTIFIDNDVTCPLGDGLLVFTSPNTIVKNNIIQKSGFTGVAISSSSNVTLENNKIIQNSNLVAEDTPLSSAVVAIESPQFNATGNIIDQSSDSGFVIESSEFSIIKNNLIINHPTSGIFLGMSSFTSIINNNFENNGIAIEIDQSTELIINENYLLEVNEEGKTNTNPLESDQIRSMTNKSYYPILACLNLICFVLFKKQLLNRLKI